MTDTINQVREALESAKAWHEAADEAISKQPNAWQGHNGWMRLEHQEQARLLEAALSLLREDDGRKSAPLTQGERELLLTAGENIAAVLGRRITPRLSPDGTQICTRKDEE